MLGYVMAPLRGDADLLISAVAARLQALGWPLAGAVQQNRGDDPALCTMELVVLQAGHRICISQQLGTGSRGCRLDSAALEQAVGLVEGALHHSPRLLILNKFGKAESEGRGFRPLIGRALGAGIPVLTGVNARNIEAFQDFAQGMGQALPPDKARILDWCHAQT
ncbi:MAG: DUF2478 domain-containing protein [Pseudomonadota bacterium]